MSTDRGYQLRNIPTKAGRHAHARTRTRAYAPPSQQAYNIGEPKYAK